MESEGPARREAHCSEPNKGPVTTVAAGAFQAAGLVWGPGDRPSVGPW